MSALEIPYVSCIGPDGSKAGSLPELAADKAAMVDLYRWMIFTRAFDTRAVALQRTGQLGTYASSLGQEAASIGLAHAMRPEDVLLPSFREHGAQMLRGVSATELLLYWGGDERGSDFANARDDFPVCIPVGSHAPHAAGVALAFKLRDEPRAALAVFGDGATSKGDVYEAMNAAGAWTLPVVFVAINNQWAISVPRSAQTAAETLAQKALAVGFPGIQVDGNDVLAVRSVVAEALDRAREGNGPTLVEALTYRLADHTTVDDASRYRDDEEVAKHWKSEPLARMREWLTRDHGWSRDEEHDLVAACERDVESAVDDFLATRARDGESIFDHLYETEPAELSRQRRAYREAQ